jgi:hypothetical protein
MAGGTKDVAYESRDVIGSRGCGGAAVNGWLGLFLLALFAHFAIVGAGARRR